MCSLQIVCWCIVITTGHSVWIANPLSDLGISLAYWISFGLAFVNNGYSDVRWRFLLAFQCLPALFLAFFIKMLPDSPRYLASVGRSEEAHELLVRIREGTAPERIEREYLEIVTTARYRQASPPLQFAKILLGKGGRPGTNLGRRAWLCVWLQIMASWTGITVREMHRHFYSSTKSFYVRRSLHILPCC